MASSALPSWGGSYFFKPRRIVVKVNVPVELALAKEPGMEGTLEVVE